MAWCFNDGMTVLSRRVGGAKITHRNTVTDSLSATDNYIYTVGLAMWASVNSMVYWLYDWTFIKGLETVEATGCFIILELSKHQLSHSTNRGVLLEKNTQFAKEYWQFYLPLSHVLTLFNFERFWFVCCYFHVSSRHMYSITLCLLHRTHGSPSPF